MTKPSFLGLLNAISVAESEAETYLLAWADTTGDDDLATTLRYVAMREGEHGKAFAKRMLELGYTVRPPESSQAAEKLEVAASDRSDVEKFEYFRIGGMQTETDVFDGMFADKTIDPITGGLLGRYIAEERDSGRRLCEARERVAAKATSKAGKGSKGTKTKTKAKAKATKKAPSPKKASGAKKAGAAA